MTHATLNNIETLPADIENAYLQAPSSEKDYIICGAKFGLENIRKVAMIRCALYGGKVAGTDFWHDLQSCMNNLGLKSYKVDPNVWSRLSKRANGDLYYEYVVLCVDDCIVISARANSLLWDEIGPHFVLKKESIGPPSQYLRGRLRKVKLGNESDAWGWGASQYMQADREER